MDAWITAAELLADDAFCSIQDLEDAGLVAKATRAAEDASEVLRRLSGGTVSGPRSVTVWPETTEAWDAGFARFPFIATYPMTEYPTEIVLEWPIISVEEVRVDGEVLVAGVDYRIDNRRSLVRLPDSDGRVRFWPLSFVDRGEHSIKYTFGTPVEPWMKLAAKEVGVSLLAEELHRARRLAAGTRGATQQGLTYHLGQAAEELRDRATPDSFPHVVRFMALMNPGNESLAPYAWSPDLGHQLHIIPD
jgi:hypothetical protein